MQPFLFKTFYFYRYCWMTYTDYKYRRADFLVFYSGLIGTLMSLHVKGFNVVGSSELFLL